MGCQPTEINVELYGTADRRHPLGDEMIERLIKTDCLGAAEICKNASFKGPEPMGLPSPGKIRKPFSGFQSIENACTDRLDRGLKAAEISARPHSHDAFAVRTTIPFDEKSIIEPVEKSPYVAMAPNFITITFGAGFGFLPWIVSPQL